MFFQSCAGWSGPIPAPVCATFGVEPIQGIAGSVRGTGSLQCAAVHDSATGELQLIKMTAYHVTVTGDTMLAGKSG